jgi:hypothetical protein
MALYLPSPVVLGVVGELPVMMQVPEPLEAVVFSTLAHMRCGFRLGVAEVEGRSTRALVLLGQALVVEDRLSLEVLAEGVLVLKARQPLRPHPLLVIQGRGVVV